MYSLVDVYNSILTDKPIKALEMVRDVDSPVARVIENKLKEKLEHILNPDKYKEKYKNDPMGWRPEGLWNTRFEWLYPKIKGSYIDLGCYEGSVVKRYSKVDRAVGVEICQAAVDWNNSFNQGEFIQSAIEEFETDERFDTVSCMEVIEHVPDDKKIIEKMLQLLKPGGTAYLSTPYQYYGNVVNMITTWELEGRLFDHVRSYDEFTLKDILPDNAEVVKEDYVLFATFKKEDK